MTSQARIAKGMWWDRAWTLTKGCTPAGAGCKNCWSAAQSHIRSQQAKPPPCYIGVTDERGKWTGHVEALSDALEVPLRVRKPTTWAIWNDLFHESVPQDFIIDAFMLMEQCPRHMFLILTKRPGRMVDVLGGLSAPPLPNVWLGASASTQAELGRVVPPLLDIPAAVRFLSLEPLLGPMTLSVPLEGTDYDRMSPRRPVDWVIIGAESGAHRRECRDEWIESIVEQCKRARVPVFVKQHHVDGRVVKTPARFPQEMPEATS